MLYSPAQAAYYMLYSPVQAAYSMLYSPVQAAYMLPDVTCDWTQVSRAQFF